MAIVMLKITFRLKDGTDIRKTVLSILAACDLPTSYVDSLPQAIPKTSTTSMSPAGLDEDGLAAVDEETAEDGLKAGHELHGTGLATSPFALYLSWNQAK